MAVPPRLEAVEQPIGCGLVVAHIMKPDRGQIIFSTCVPNDRQKIHAASSDRKRLRASALISSIDANRPGPLSIPSCTNLRSSSTV